jgi:hypothetical protein
MKTWGWSPRVSPLLLPHGLHVCHRRVAPRAWWHRCAPAARGEAPSRRVGKRASVLLYMCMQPLVDRWLSCIPHNSTTHRANVRNSSLFGSGSLKSHLLLLAFSLVCLFAGDGYEYFATKHCKIVKSPPPTHFWARLLPTRVLSTARSRSWRASAFPILHTK